MNSINYTVRLSAGCGGGVLWCGNSLTHKRSGLNLELQWHLCCSHVHGRSHAGNVFFCGLLLNVYAFMRV